MKGMKFFGYHGVYAEENRLGQRFRVDLELKLDLSAAASTDDLRETVNYAELHALTKSIVEGPPFKLIEALAGHIASRVLQAYTRINEVTVRVIKPHPPFDVEFDGVAIELTRKRDEHGHVVPV